MDEGKKSIEPEAVEKMGFLSRIAGIFFEPRKVFNFLNNKPSWFPAFILILVISIIVAQIILPQSLLLQKEIVSQIPQLSSAPPEVLDKIAEVDTAKRINSAVGEILKNLIGIFLLTSLVYFFCNIILGGDSRYKKVLSVVTYASFVPILGAVLKTPLIIVKNSADIQTSLALLMPEGDVTKIRYLLLSFVDIFSIWEIILIALGLTVLYKFTKGKAYTASLISWLVLAIFGIGLSVLGMSISGVPISW
ncbi:MAG: YIP1 family protein [candidate division Zixibacteria bacterium]|nr:YIP1 family protein [candidate division Zixibacteria bacterium]